MYAFQQKLKDPFFDQRKEERHMRPVGPVRPWAVAALAATCLGLAVAPAPAAIQSMFGSYLATHNAEVDTFNTIVLHDGDAVATRFQIFQKAPFITPVLKEIKLALSKTPFSPTGNESITIEFYEDFGNVPFGSPKASLMLDATDYANLNPYNSFPGYTNVIWQPSNFIVLSRTSAYWIAVRFHDSTTPFPSELHWHLNKAGVTEKFAAESFGFWFPSSSSGTPAIKVRADVNEGCPHSSFMSGAIFGPPFSTTSYELHVELLCPQAVLKYFNCANVVVPAGTSSYDAADIMVQAIQGPSSCPANNGSGFGFSAERSGNIVRVSHANCPCSGAYVCGDPAGILSFARTMGYQNEGIAMKVNLFFGGLATGVSADPLIPPGVQIVHEVHLQPNMPPQVFTALFSPGAGATPAQVAQGLKAQLQNDSFVTAVGDKLRLDAPAGDPPGYFDIAYRINDTGLLWAFAPFDRPDPFHVFGSNKCLAGKIGCVSKKKACLLQCYNKALGARHPVDPTACLQKCRDEFTGGAVPTNGCFAKLEADNAGPCKTTGDTEALEVKIDAFVRDVVAELDPQFPTLPLNKCAAGKVKCISAKDKCVLSVHAKAAKVGPPPDATALAKCRAKYDGTVPTKGCFAKLEAKVGCLTTGDTAAIEAKDDAFIDDVLCELNGLRCVSTGAANGRECCTAAGAAACAADGGTCG